MVYRRHRSRRHGVSLSRQFEPQLGRLTSIGLLEVDDRRVRLTQRGALLANRSVPSSSELEPFIRI